jgi:hypothetical protein
MSMSLSVERLRTIQEIIRTGGAMPADLARWVQSGLDRFLKRQARDLDDAFGLYMGQGGVPWWREEAIARRDEALRRFAAASREAPAGITARARFVAQAIRRYGSSAWLLEREHDAPPATAPGTPREFLWRAFKSGAPMPLGERQLRTILSH